MLGIVHAQQPLGSTRTRFYTDIDNGAAITTPRVFLYRERMLVGDAVNYSTLNDVGNAQFGWLNKDVGPSYIVRDATIGVVNGDGGVGIGGATKASLASPGQAADPIGVAGFALSDNASVYSVWAGYFEATRQVAASTAIGIEVDVRNGVAGVVAPTPYDDGTGPHALWIACGPAVTSNTPPLANSGAAMVVLQNTGGSNTFKFTKGVVINATALAGVTGVDGEGAGAGALEMGRGHGIRWYAQGGALKVGITSRLDSTDPDWSVYWLSNTMTFARNSAAENVLLMTGVASGANYLQLQNAVAGSPPMISALGSDADVDLRLVPKGTGVVRYGTNTAKAAEAFASYITIKDGAGTLRKLMVCA